MWLTPTALYWSSLGLVAYTYGGYPLLITALARLRPRPLPPRSRAVVKNGVKILAALASEMPPPSSHTVNSTVGGRAAGS